MNIHQPNSRANYSKIPRLAAGEHPVEKNVYRLPTYAIENMLNSVYGWIEKLTPGAMIYGNPRTGKTESIFEMMKILPELLGNDLPIELLDCAKYAGSSSTESQFYSDILAQLGYVISSRGTASIKLLRIVEFISQRVREAKDYRFILFLDEAQSLHENHFKWLMGIHNLLNIKKIHIITFLVGQPELITLRSSYAASSQRQIIGRFMVGTHEFRGVTSTSEMEVLLKGFDQIEYPENSGCSFTEYFLPIAYGNGLRIHKNASLIMECHKNKLAKETSLKPAHIEIPMQSIPQTIGYILQTLSQNDDKNLSLDKSIVNEAIDYSDFMDLTRNVIELPLHTELTKH